MFDLLTCKVTQDHCFVQGSVKETRRNLDEAPSMSCFVQTEVVAATFHKEDLFLLHSQFVWQQEAGQNQTSVHQLGGKWLPGR